MRTGWSPMPRCCRRSSTATPPSTGAIQPAFDALLDVVEDVLPIDLEDLRTAKDLVMGGYRSSARDALHVAVMRRHGIAEVMSFDRGFDRYPGLRRVC